MLKVLFKFIGQTQIVSHQNYFLKSSFRKSTFQNKLSLEAWTNKLLISRWYFADAGL